MAINTHKAKVHTEKKYSCSLGCKKSFKDSWYLKRHEERICIFSPTREEWIKKEEASGKTAAMKAKKKLGRKIRNEQYKILRKNTENMKKVT